MVAKMRVEIIYPKRRRTDSEEAQMRFRGKEVCNKYRHAFALTTRNRLRSCSEEFLSVFVSLSFHLLRFQFEKLLFEVSAFVLKSAFLSMASVTAA